MKTPILWLKNKRIYIKLISSCLLSLLLATIPIALANSDYKPPSDQEKPSDYTQSDQAGSRGGCQGIEEIPLTLLAPQNHIGQTMSVHPTFAWFVPDSEPVQIELRLFEYDINDKPTILVEVIQLESSQGIVKHTLSEKPGLEVGKKYLWQVRINCPDGYPPVIKRADIQVVEMPSVLTETSDSSDQVDSYAKAGLWYDALGKALEMSEEGKLGRTAARLLEELANLEEAEIAEELTDQAAEQLRIRHLRQLASDE